MRHKLFLLSCLTGILVASGCNLEVVEAPGEICPPGEGEFGYILERIDGTMTKCKAGDGCHPNTFKYGTCPNAYQHCLQDAEKQFYCSECPEGTIKCGDRCVDPLKEEEYCGAKGACSSEDIESADYMGVVCDGTESCIDGLCAQTVCKDYEHSLGNGMGCEADSSLHCGSHENDCTRLEGWFAGECVNKKCVARICNQGYRVNPETELCSLETSLCCGDACEKCVDSKPYCSNGKCTEECGGVYVPCEETVNGSTFTRCINPTADVDYCGADNQCSNYMVCEEEQTCYLGQCFSIKTECSENQHMYGNYCEDNSLEHCGMHDFACAKEKLGWKEGTCENGKCVPSECAENFHLGEDGCVADTNLCCGAACQTCGAGTVCWDGECQSNCGEGMVVCSTGCAIIQHDAMHCGACDTPCQPENVDNSVSVVCSGGVCLAETCAVGFHLVAGRCQADDLDNCGKQGWSCQQNVSGWASGECRLGVCVPTQCVATYHMTEDNKCEPDTNLCCGSKCESCGANKVCSNGVCASNCSTGLELCSDGCANLTSNNAHCGSCESACNSTTVPNSTESFCSHSKCKASKCRKGYHIENDQCVEDTATACGEGKTDCTKNHYATAGVCENGVCRSTACALGYHLKNGVCEPDTDTECGNALYNCKTHDYASDGVCQGGQCIAKDCVVGYHLENNVKCEADTNTVCGKQRLNCMLYGNANAGVCESGQCVATSCKSNYHVKSGACVLDSKTECGNALTNCTTLPNVTETECYNGGCFVLRCQTGYHLELGKCVEDGDDACGTPTVNCKTSNHASDGKCNHGVCTSTACVSGYALKNGACVLEVTCCGSLCTDCTLRAGWVDGYCNNGSCKATECSDGYTLGAGWCMLPVIGLGCTEALPIACGDGTCCKTRADCLSPNAMCLRMAMDEFIEER